MNYQKIYTNLIEKCKNSRYDSDLYVEKHHIIPRCIGGSDDAENIVLMPPRHHFIAHQLLYKIHKDKKLLYAINMMTIHNSEKRNNNRKYGWLKESFSKNHPCKDLLVKDKISSSLKKYYVSIDYNEIKKEKFWKYRERRECLCGCGQNFIVYKKDNKKYFSREHSPRPNYEIVSRTLKNTLSKLTKEEHTNRIKNSFLSSDNVDRGKKISKGKKGKKTNQQEIMGIRYSGMNDNEFEIFLKSKNVKMHNRLRNLREKYLCKNLK